MPQLVGTRAPLDALVDHPRAAFADLRWSTPSQWLMTLRPLGHVDDATAGAVRTTEGPGDETVAPFPLGA